MWTRQMQDQARKSAWRSVRFQTSRVMRPGTTAAAWLRWGHSQGPSIKWLPREGQVLAEPACSSSFTTVLGDELATSSVQNLCEGGCSLWHLMRCGGDFEPGGVRNLQQQGEE